MDAPLIGFAVVVILLAIKILGFLSVVTLGICVLRVAFFGLPFTIYGWIALWSLVGIFLLWLVLTFIYFRI